MNNLGAHRGLAWATRDVVIGLPDRMTVPVSHEATSHAKAVGINSLALTATWRELFVRLLVCSRSRGTAASAHR
jgi:hypothetical protein